MMAIVEFLAEVLPLEPEGRRAVDEVLADWRHEVGGASGLGRRTVGHLRGAGAVAGTLVRLAAVEAMTARAWTRLTAAVALALLLACLLVVRTWPVSLAQVAWPDRPLLFLLLLPSALASALPLSVLSPPFSVRRGGPVLGLALLLLVIGGATAGWLAPASNRTFDREFAFAAVRYPPNFATTQTRIQTRGVAYNYSVAELVERSREPAFEGLRARQALSDRLGFIALAPAALILGVQSRRFANRRGWRIGGGALAWAIAALAAYPAVLLIIGVQSALRAQFYPADEIRLIQGWVTVFVACLAAGLMARHGRGGTTTEPARETTT